MTFKSSLTLIACCLGTFLLLVHTTSATVSVSAIQADLHAGFAEGQWIINAFTLAVGALLIAGGAVGDVIGHRHVFTAGMVAFVAGTTTCGLAPSAGMLIAGRLIQGVGGAAILASMIPLIVHTYTGQRRAVALSIWSISSAAGGTAGTLGSGVLAHPGTWRWLFLGSLPFAIAALVASVAMVVELPDDSRQRGRFDIPGMVSTVILAGSATFTLISVGEFGIASASTLGAATLAIIALAGLVLIERRSKSPALPPALFRNRAFVATIITAFAYYLAAFGPLPVLAIWLTTSTGMGPAVAGALLAVQQVGFILAAALARVPEKRHGMAVLVGMAMIVAGVLLAAAIVFASLPTPLILVSLVLSGGGAGLVTPILPHRATEAAAPSLAGAAAGTFNTARQLGLAFGVAACSAVAQISTTHGHGTGLALILAATIALTALLAQLVLRDTARVDNVEKYAHPGNRRVGQSSR